MLKAATAAGRRPGRGQVGGEHSSLHYNYTCNNSTSAEELQYVEIRIRIAVHLFIGLHPRSESAEGHSPRHRHSGSTAGEGEKEAAGGVQEAADDRPGHGTEAEGDLVEGKRDCHPVWIAGEQEQEDDVPETGAADALQEPEDVGQGRKVDLNGT